MRVRRVAAWQELLSSVKQLSTLSTHMGRHVQPNTRSCSAERLQATKAFSPASSSLSLRFSASAVPAIPLDACWKANCVRLVTHLLVLQALDPCGTVLLLRPMTADADDAAEYAVRRLP